MDQLEAGSPHRVQHLLGFMCQHPCRRQRDIEGGRRTKGGREGGVKLRLYKLGTCLKIQSYCNRAGTSLDRGCLRRRWGRKMSSSNGCCWPQFSKASPSRDLPSLPIISLFILSFKRPHMMDDFWWASFVCCWTVINIVSEHRSSDWHGCNNPNVATLCFKFRVSPMQLLWEGNLLIIHRLEWST